MADKSHRIFTIAKTLAEVISKLNIKIQDILYWFKINGLVANPGKFKVMFLGKVAPISTFSIGNIKAKNQAKLLGIFIDDKLRFNSHVEFKCQSVGNKICLLYTSPSPRDGLLSRMPSSA